MLIACPECGRTVSDRAVACPDCAFPVAAEAGKGAALAPSPAAPTESPHQPFVASRKPAERAVDCPKCEGRGWHLEPQGTVFWCIPCEATGRVALYRADDGYYAVAEYAIERFMSGELQPGKSGVVFFLGPSEPAPHRFPDAAQRLPVDPDEIPW